MGVLIGQFVARGQTHLLKLIRLIHPLVRKPGNRTMELKRINRNLSFFGLCQRRVLTL